MSIRIMGAWNFEDGATFSLYNIGERNVIWQHRHHPLQCQDYSDLIRILQTLTSQVTIHYIKMEKASKLHTE